jgi:hypothetical protein
MCSWETRHLHAAAGELGVDRVVVAIDPHIRLRRDTHHLASVDIRHSLRERAHPLALLSQSLDGHRADRAMHPPIHTLAPAVELQLEVGRVREPAAGLEVRTQEPVRALNDSFGLRIGRLEDDPADLELTAERGERLARATATSDCGLPIPHQLLRQHPQPNKTATQTHKMSEGSLEKIRLPAITRDQHTSAVTT